MKNVALFRAGVLAGVCLLAPAAWVAAGPVTYQSQSRTIRADLLEEYEMPDDQTISLRDEETASAPGFGDFDATVTAQIDNPPIPPGESAPGASSVSQRSSLSDAGITASGQGRGQTFTQEGFYSFDSSLDVTFTLDEARTFDLDYELGFGTLIDIREQIRLTTADGATVIFDEEIEFGNTPPDGNAVGSRTGELAPGQYRFEFLYGVGSDVGNTVPYSVSLALTPTDGGPGPNPIPLPPAAWSALATAGAMGALKLRRRLRSPGR